MAVLSELEVSALCRLEGIDLPFYFMVINPSEGKVVVFPDEEIELYYPRKKVTHIGEPMGSIIIWRAIDG